MKRALVLFISITIFSFLIIRLSVLAQTVPAVSGMDLSVSTSNPSPDQTVIVTARSYNIDINSATVTWTVDGKMIKKGIGLTTLDVTAPSLGKITAVKVTATTPGGMVVSGSINIQSGYVDMIVEPNGYTPPFFKGKLPISYQNTISVIAFPHIAKSNSVEYDPATLIYQWERNNQVIEDQSGYGKQSITLLGDIVPRPFTVTVTVTSQDGKTQTSGYLPISFTDPSLEFYVDDPLYGPLYNMAKQGSINLGLQKETTILAVPFGFSGRANDLKGLTYDWKINSISHPELSSNNSIILRVPEGETGSSNVSLIIQNQAKILQGAKKSFLTLFGGQKSSGSNVPINF